MKLSFLFIFFSCIGLFANSYGQMNIDARGKTVREVLKNIEEQSQYSFFYNSEFSDLDKLVQMSFENKNINEILSAILDKTAVSYRIMENNFIIITPVSLMQQAISITGTVRDEAGGAMPGVNVVVKGTTTGVVTDIDGKFNINVPNENAVLLFSFVGYVSKEMPVGTQRIFAVELVEGQEIEEVVVTALGIKKEKVKVTYAIQEVKGDDMVKARESNALGGLTGKVAGLQIANSTNLYASPEISLRGVKPLIVVDGVPIESDSWNLSSDDIESFSVLKGPSASVLYGSRGKNGAIQITTKRGAQSSKGYTVEFNSSTMLEAGFLTIPEVQNQYGSGQNGKYRYGDGTPSGGGLYDNSFYIWGPKLDVLNPNTPSGYNETEQWDSPIDPVTGKRIPTALRSRGKDNLYNFLETGLLSTNNLAVTAKYDKGDLRFSATHVYEKGSVPNTHVNVTTFNMSGGLDLTDKFRLEANVTYNRQYTDNYPDLAYNPANFIYGIYIWTGPDIDIRDFKDYWVPGREGLQQKWYENTFYNNPYFIANEATRGYYRDNTYGSLAAKYSFTPGLNLTVRTHLNSFSLYRDYKYPYSYKSGDAYKQKGAYEEEYQNYVESNTDALLTFDKDFFSDFNFNGMLGGNYRTYDQHNIKGKTSSLNIPEWYNLSNTTAQIQPTNEIKRKQVVSAYGTGEFSYKRTYFFNFSGRWDKSSTLPAAKNNYFYPSVGGSVIVSRAVRLPDFISYAKLRGSWAKVGSDLDLYQTSPVYSMGTTWGESPSLYYSRMEYNSLLEPEFSTSFEVGGELQFFNNRIGFDLSYFNSIDGPQIFELPLSYATGKTSRQVNGREYKRTGWEVVLTANPFRNPNGFGWNIAVNWSTYKKTLNKIYGDETKLDYISVGERADAMYYTVTEKSPDGQVVHENGWPKYDPSTIKVKLGNYNPDWIIGVNNTLSYKNFRFSFLIDGRVGGKVYSAVNAMLWESGRHINSVNQSRDDYNDGKVNYIGEGVKVVTGELKRDGDGNIISDTRVFAPNDAPISYFNYVQYWNARGCYESNIFSKSFIKLREVTLTYNFSPALLSKTFIKQASVSLVGRNLLYFANYKYTDMDPVVGKEDGLQTPSVRKFGLNLNITF